MINSYLDAQMNAFCRFAVQELNTKLLGIAAKHNVTMIDLFSLFTDHGMKERVQEK
jgi:hypothetical protein